MNTSENKIENKRATDPIDQLIFEEGLRIKSLWIDKALDMIIVLLNNKKLLKSLTNASPSQLADFENDGTGIHWPQLDEDISLRWFLKYELSRIVIPIGNRTLYS
jgi:hypothetical protein